MGKRIIILIKYIFKCINEVIFPHTAICLCCGRESENAICNNCIKNIFLIHDSVKTSFYDDLMNPCCYYNLEIKKIILKFKYTSDFYAGEFLARMLAHKIESLNIENPLITYIPSSDEAKKKRGFDQCEFLCKKVYKLTNIKYEKLLLKSSEVKEQKTLSRDERIINLKSAFQSYDKCKGRNIIVIDDIITTGSTMHYAKKSLLEKGAKKVFLVSVAKSTI